MSADKESSGVNELIQRLREQGVAEGQTRAQELFEQARLQAEQRLEDARREADAILETAREEGRQVRAAGEEAVRLACRDAILQLKVELIDQFSDRVRRLITRKMQDENLLKQLILEVTQRAIPPADRSVTLLLPPNVVGLEELRRTPEDVKEGTLSHFIVTVTRDLLRDGIEIGDHDEGHGIRIRLQEDDLEIDLSDTAVATLLLRHLVPRFRALMEGMIQ
ncbi:MAG: hypothetical protein KDA90_05135 [Planctomycetaceae bacterium]|nr:hypothetical protein [Planctomycetaceae bacterium]